MHTRGARATPRTAKMVKFDPAIHVRTYAEVEAGTFTDMMIQKHTIGSHDAAANIFRRQDDDACDPCLEKPKCPDSCPSGQVCNFTLRSCDTCARAICIDNVDNLPENSGSSSGGGPNTGAIAGGVVGGVAAIAILTYLVWRFCIKTKRENSIRDTYDGGLSQRSSQGEKDVDVRHAHRSSVHTVHSIASTVLTRASNIIQIAYIPGVTNRATPNSPGVLVPPVPPIPIHAGSNPNSPSYEEQHFFTPGDLRNSTYSGLSGESDRGSFARTSYAPRSSIAPSIASTIYGKNAVVVAPAQTGMRAKAAMVSVKSMGGNSSGDESIPAVPAIDYEKFDTAPTRDSTFSVGSTFLNNANTATVTQSRAQVIRVGSGNQVKQISVGSAKSAASTPAIGSPNRMTPAASVASVNVRDSDAPTIIEDSPSMDQGPFSDPPRSSGTNQSMSSSASSLSAVIEEATRRAASGPDRKSKRQSDAAQRATSPFSDEHATKE